MQVRNLRSCIKVAVDFVSTASLLPCQEMVQRLRSICLDDKDCSQNPLDHPFHDKLQVRSGVQAFRRSGVQAFR